MLAGMTSRELSEWQAFYVAENHPEDAQIDALGLSEQAQRKLREKLSKRRKR